MPKVIVTAAVNDVEEWLKSKADMVPAMAAVAAGFRVRLLPMADAAVG